MRKYVLSIFFIVLFAVLANQTFAASSSQMTTYLDRYCDDMLLIDDCGRYDSDIDDARKKAKKYTIVLNSYSSTKRVMLVNHMLKTFSDIFDTHSDVSYKLTAAYYYDYFSDIYGEDEYEDDIIDYFFNDASSTYRPTYQTAPTYRTTRTTAIGGAISSMRGINGTTVSTSREEIRASRDVVDFSVKVIDTHARAITSSDEYRVVAKLDERRDRTFAASYTSNGNRRFRIANSFDRNDEITMYLLCKNCSGGQRFSSDSILDGWRIIDSEQYDVISTYDAYDDYYDDDYYYNNNSYYRRNDDRYSSRDEDLALLRVRYDWHYDNRDVTVRVTSLVENQSRYDNTINDIHYRVEVDNDLLSSRDYDVDHIRTNCDDSSVSSRENDDIDIDGRDECEVTVEFTFDRDDVEDEILEIRSFVSARRDNDSRNNDQTVRFRID